MINVLTKYKCLICNKVTEPEPEDGYEYEVEETKDYVCDECKRAVAWVKEQIPYWEK